MTIPADTTNSAPSMVVFPTIDHNHPLFLQHTDTLGSSLISLQLIGSENYALWSRSFRIGLVGRSKLVFVDGCFPKSMFKPVLYDQWEKCNVVVLSWIINAVQPGLLSSVVYASDARKVWLDLREYSKLRDLWDEYDALMPCPSCPCPESRKFGEHCEYQRLLQFLMGLNESYYPPRSQILMMNPIPTLNKAYALLMDQESLRNLVSSTSTSLGVGAIDGTTLYSHRGPTYTHGFGSFKVSSSMISGGSNGGASTSGSYKGRRTLVQCDHSGCKGVQSTTIQHPGALFTQDQYQQILQLLSRSGGETAAAPPARVASVDAGIPLSTFLCACDAGEWIVDNGATHHITSQLNTLATSTEALANLDSRVHLPNGNTVSVSHIGGAKPAYTPLEVNQKLTSVQYDEHINNGIPEGDTILTDITKYQRLVGKIFYLN
ncbi:hypothetical protein KY289_032190 [Solanum tuberosum]|nr:hypothetical protein KY284_030813 [Solanum tuberosum]KAH0654512.1 hypothetical protein KY289_032190 [Solanum tuberosum]